MSLSSTDIHTISKPNGRATLACLQGRERYRRCNGATPVCGPCRADGKLCNYAKSQRGGLNRATLARKRAAMNCIGNPTCTVLYSQRAWLRLPQEPYCNHQVGSARLPDPPDASRFHPCTWVNTDNNRNCPFDAPRRTRLMRLLGPYWEWKLFPKLTPLTKLWRDIVSIEVMVLFTQ